MVRSMYSGVSGLRSHQTRMDTIGNNIANVNTYGFKSSRTTFRDIYYQNLKNAASPTAAQGGVNPSQVGYGGQVGSVDVMMGRSTFSMTDQGMDMAIDGDGFFQVQDANGNMYYTRAGMLNFDSAGNLVDMQGNYVLGVNGDPTGRAPSSERITVSLPNVQPAPGSVTQTINGKEYTITASNNTIDSNINFNFSSDTTITDGVKAVAKLSTTGIIITFNANETFANWGEVNEAVNEAIRAANGGKDHVAGEFNIEYTGDASTDPFLTANMPDGRSPSYLTGAELASTDYGTQYGKVSLTSSAGSMFGGVSPNGTVGAGFSASGDSASNYSCAYDGTSSPAKWNFSLTIGGQTYTGTVDSTKTAAGTFNLYNTNGDTTDYIQMKRPSFDGIMDAWFAQKGDAGEKAKFVGNVISAPITASSVSIDGVNIPDTVYDSTNTSISDQLQKIAKAYNDSSSPNYVATVLNGNQLVLTAKSVGAVTPNPTITNLGTWDAGASDGGRDAILKPDDVGGLPFDVLGTAQLTGSASPSGPSYALGLSGQALTLRGGTEGGPQTIADMTGLAIGTDGIIVGYDSQGTEVIIGRIDLATFANQNGLNQAGSTNFTASANSGAAVLTQAGLNGAGQLVSGTLELSNVDLSREFSDMITTQRGYQANSRIITVSDTMLEELINLKR